MQPPSTTAAPAAPLKAPLDTPYTAEQLAQCDGVQSPSIWVAIKGSIFDVTANEASYGVGKGYHVFAGKDASRALGKSSLKAEDCVADYSDFSEEELATLNKWFTFFEKRYNIIGKVVQ